MNTILTPRSSILATFLSAVVLPSTLSAQLSTNCTPCPAGIVAWWPGDWSTTNLAGTGGGTLRNGASFLDGHVGGAFSFDGVDDFVEVVDHPDLNPPVAITVTAWINPRGHVGNYDPIIKKSGSASGYALEFNGSYVQFYVYVGWWRASAYALVPLNAYSHVAGVYDGTSLRLFMNGNEVGPSTAVSGTITAAASNLNLGRDPSNTNRLYRGEIDEAAIFDRALAAAEIAAIYSAGTNGMCKGALPPLALNEVYNAPEGHGLTVKAPGVLANDKNRGGGTLTAEPLSPPAHGGLLLNSDGGFNYTPAAGFNGTDAFTYLANNGSMAATGSVTIFVYRDPMPVNLTLTNVVIQGQPRTLELHKRPVRAPGFHYLTWSAAAGYTTNLPTPVRTYRGTVVSASNTLVCAFINPNGMLDAAGFDYEQAKSHVWRVRNVNVSSQLPVVAHTPLLGPGAAISPASGETPDLVLGAPCGHLHSTQLPGSSNNSAPEALQKGQLPLSTFMPPAKGMQLLDLGLDITHAHYVADGTNPDLTISAVEHEVNLYDFTLARDAMIAVQESVVVIRQDRFYFPADPGEQLNQTVTAWKREPLLSLPWDQIHTHATEQGMFGIGGFAWQDSLGKDEAPVSVEALHHEVAHNWDEIHYGYGADAMGGAHLNHGPISIDRLLRKRAESMVEGDLVAFPGTYSDPLPPYTHVDCASTLTNAPVIINVLTNDWDANGDALTVVAFSTNTPRGGLVSQVGSSVLRYMPAAGYVGKDIFAYTVQDSTGLKTRDLVHVEVVNRDLAVHYTFDETSGKTVSDVTGNGHPGKLQGGMNFTTCSEPGVNGLALRVGHGGIICDNSPLTPADVTLNTDPGYWPFDSVSMSRGNFFDPMDESCTLVFWFKPYAAYTRRNLLKKEWDGEQAVGFKLDVSNGGLTATVHEFDGLSSIKTLRWPGPLAVGRWYHVAYQFDRSDHQARLYVDGVLRATAMLDAGRLIFQGRQPLLLGADADGWLVFDDFRFYTKALSLEEIQGLYAPGQIPAGGPNPGDGESDVALAPVLTWMPGRSNYLHDVFFGTNLAAVTSATTTAFEYRGRYSVPSFIPGALLPSQQYFWRVDEVLEGTNIAPGSVWSFTTAPEAICGGLKIYLSLDSRDTVGSVTYDRAGPPFNDGNLYNAPARASGRIAEALEFDGASTYIEIPKLNLTTDAASFVAWVKRSGPLNDYSGLVFQRGTQVSGMGITTGNRLGYHWNSEANTYNFTGGPVLPSGQWALAAVVVEPNRAIVYLGTTNGVLTAATNTVVHGLCAFDGPLRLASDSVSGDRYFKGGLDEVGFWNRALTRAELGQMLTNGINGISLRGSHPDPDTNTFTWLGGADRYWTNALNWATRSAPGAGNTVSFNDSAVGNTDTELGTDLSVAGINISGDLRGVGISGTNTLTVAAGGVTATNSTAAVTLASRVILGAAQRWEVGPDATVTLTGALAAPGNPLITVSGGGRVNLNSGANGPFAGTLLVNAGTVSLHDGGWYNAFTQDGAVVVSSGARLIFQGVPYGAYGNNTTRVAGTLVVNSAATYVPNLELTGGTVEGPGTLRVGGYWGAGRNYISRASAITSIIQCPYVSLEGIGNFFVEDGSAPVDWRISSVIQDGHNGPGGITKTGTGTLSLTEANTYTGNTTNKQGTLNLDGVDNVLPVSTGLHVAAGAVVNLNGYNQAVCRLTGFGVVNLGAGTLTVAESATNIFSGVLTGSPAGVRPPSDNSGKRPNPGGLTMAGTGRAIFSGVNSYSGDTLINSGVLALSGGGTLSASSNLVLAADGVLDVTSRTAGSLPLAGGQALRGNGQVLGVVLVNANAVISPGLGIGTLKTGSQTWAEGGIYDWEIADATLPQSRDSLVVTGALNVSATPDNPFVVRLTSPVNPLPGFNNATPYNWTLLTTTSGVLNFAANKFRLDVTGLGVDPAGGRFSVEQQGNTLLVRFTPQVTPTPPMFTSIALSNGTIFLGATGALGQTFVLQTTTNLHPAYWHLLSTQTVGGSSSCLFTNPQAGNRPQQFYRIQLQP